MRRIHFEKVGTFDKHTFLVSGNWKNYTAVMVGSENRQQNACDSTPIFQKCSRRQNWQQHGFGQLSRNSSNNNQRIQ